MSAPWRVLDFLDFEGSIHSVDGAINVVKPDGSEVRVPVADVSVVLVGYGVSFSAASMHRLTAAGASVLFCDWRGIPESASYTWSTHTRVGARQRAQAFLSLPRQKHAWQQLVRAKVLGQAATLKFLELGGHQVLEALAKEVRSGDPQNIEAQAAKSYWKHFGHAFSRKPRSKLGQGYNSCLDYGYTILRGHGIRAVLAAGLSPALGVFHRGRSNGFNLVDDLIEPFRPCVDTAVALLPYDASVRDPEVKRSLVAVSNDLFLSGGASISASLEDLAQHFGQYVEGDLDRFVVPSWKGKVYRSSEMLNHAG